MYPDPTQTVWGRGRDLCSLSQVPQRSGATPGKQAVTHTKKTSSLQAVWLFEARGPGGLGPQEVARARADALVQLAWPSPSSHGARLGAALGAGCPRDPQSCLQAPVGTS